MPWMSPLMKVLLGEELFPGKREPCEKGFSPEALESEPKLCSLPNPLFLTQSPGPPLPSLGISRMLKAWVPFWFFPLQRSLVLSFGCSVRLMVLLAQGPMTVEVTWRLPSVLFTFTGTSPIHHRTEGVGIPWKEQLHCRDFSKEQEEESSLAGAVGREGQQSARHPDFLSPLPPGPSLLLTRDSQGASERPLGSPEELGFSDQFPFILSPPLA